MSHRKTEGQQQINNNPKKIEKISDKARDLLHGLLNKDPNKRLTIDEILNHPWLKSEETDRHYNINNKYKLFTKEELIMLSKNYIDYRIKGNDDLKEIRKKANQEDPNSFSDAAVINLTNNVIVGQSKSDPSKDYKRKKFLGEGSFASVYLVQNRITESIRAMKIINKSSNTTEEDEKEIVNEINILNFQFRLMGKEWH